MHFNTGRLELKNVRLLDSNDNVACEALLIGFHVPKHLRIDMTILLENYIMALNETDYSLNGLPVTDGG